MLPDAVYELTEAGLFLMVLATTAAVALVIHLAFQWKRLAPPALADLSPVLQTLCGTLFVLSVTFLANNVWQTEARARETVNAEARNMRLVRTYMNALTSPGHDDLARLLSAYVAATVAEWPGMEDRGGSREAEAALAALYRAAAVDLTDGDQNRLLQDRILSGLDAMALARQNRITIALDEHVSGGQWFSVAAMAVLLFIVISLCHADTPRARAIALGVMSVAISLAFYVILSHDRPFVGFQAITPDSIVSAAA